ncbi:uncharacterized protein I303_103168 [Kwoniella dejecticola CBS 10117]|uniref:Dynactin 2 n=1 Tax=Kwoniella dejecticola CBS 10117 TaxID=1296121 RepID=A0A1A6AAT9_9TREE|nr:uncharacterized protein I303_03189 [Kwoniella dejecticola CBS 10117]OBR87165.1 hypothetical protein I303_03189 [Kwoniella dejecticola CBS 10117]
MSSKYQGLPDIDTAQDIFETPDEPDTLLRPADSGLEDDDRVIPKSASENIDSTGLPGRKRVEQVFGRGIRRKDPKDLTFRPRLPPLSRHSLSSDEDEEPEPRPQLRESATSRLRRLKAELAELESEISSQPQASSSQLPQEGKRKSVLPPKQPLDLISELSGLKDRLGKLDIDGLPEADETQIRTSGWSERLSRLNGQSPVAIRPEESIEDSGKDVSLGEIDKRLAVLEGTLGPISDGIDQNGPIIPILSKHSHLLSLLTQPRQLDAISRRIKLLLVDLDRAATASKRSPAIPQGVSDGSKPSSSITISQAEYNQLQQLFGLINRLDTYLPILQPLLIRLKSLNQLHNEVGTIAESFKKLQDEEKQDSGEIKQLEEILGKVSVGLDGAVAGIMKNWESTESRMRALEERLGKLENQ